MLTMFTLAEWKTITDRGTSGDQVHDILASWGAERKELHSMVLDLAMYIGIHDPQLRAHKQLLSMLKDLIDATETED